MKINLPVFKDEDAKDTVTYQSWRWDLTVYQCAGCRDCTLLPYPLPLRKLKGNHPLLKKPAVHLVHLEEEDAGDDENQEIDDPGGIEGVIEEFMVCLARAVKDTQADEKHCYHCSSPEHFICNCPLVKTSREKKQLNDKEGTASMKGAQTPLTTTNAMKSP